jgi:hypothetical protein
MNTRAVASGFAVAVLLAGGPIEAVAQSGMQVGSIRVVKVEGRAWQVSTRGQQELLREGVFVRTDSRIDTTDSGTVVLLFENGSTIEVKPGTQFVISEFLLDPFDSSKVDYRNIKAEPSKSVTRVSVPEGSIIANIRPLRRGSDFAVATPLGTAGIRGTTFFVQSSPDSVSVGVAEGAVQFTSSQGGTRSITAGNSIGVGPSGQFGAPSPSAGALMDAAQEAAAATPPEVPAGPGTFPSDATPEDAASATSESSPDLAASQDQALQDAAAQGEQALLETSAQLASDSPEQAASIATRAAELMPLAAPEIASAVAQSVPAAAAQVAAAVASSVPSAAPQVAASVSQAVPAAAVQVAGAVSQAVPAQAAGVAGAVAAVVPPAEAPAVAQAAAQAAPAEASNIASAVSQAAPTANQAAVQNAANTGAQSAAAGGQAGGGSAGGASPSLPSGASGGGGGSGGRPSS